VRAQAERPPCRDRFPHTARAYSIVGVKKAAARHQLVRVADWMPLTTEAIARALLITWCAALVACTPLRPVDERADAGQVRRDAAQPDAGEPDAGPADSGPGDAGPGDAGPDAGVDGGPTCPDDCTT